MSLIELAQSAGLNPKRVAATDGGEYHSACPACGGKDRFIIHPNKKMKNCSGSYWCRQCGIHGDSIQFCREFLGLDFHEAVEQAGATLPENIRVQQLLSLPTLRTETYSPATLKPPSNVWQAKAALVVEEAYCKLLEQREVLQYLEKRGFLIDAVKKYKLGWILQDTWHDGCEWGFEENEKKKVWLPKGILIPTMQKGVPVRIKIRRHDYKKDDELPKYVAVSGSMNGLNIIGKSNGNAMIVVESELDAYAMHFIVGDLAVIVGVGSSMKNPDNVTNHLATRVSHLLVCHDNDDTGNKMFAKWKQLYSHAKAYPTPIGKDIGEAIQEVFDIRVWILEEIRPNNLKNFVKQKS